MLNRRHAQRGLSVVELMVGVAIGLFVVAAASMLVSSQLSSNRRLLLDTQIQQDLRATVDIITRELRRSGSLNNPTANMKVWSAATAASGVDGNKVAYEMDVPGTCGTEVKYRYYRVSNDLHGFDLNSNAIRTMVPDSGYQQLTDSSVLKVTSFCVEPVAETRTRVPCPSACPGGGDACWPEVVVRDYRVTVSGEATNDASIQRSLSSTVRVRNDFVADNSDSDPDTAYADTRLCPP
jgi:type II secretory pathway component PulJ